MKREDRGTRATVPDTEVPEALRRLRETEKAPMLVVLTGPQLGERVRLVSPTVVGRDPDSQLVLTDERVGWRQALVEQVEETWHVRDLAGDGTTTVNGQVVTAPLPLSQDDQLTLGHTVVRYEVHDPIEQAYDEQVLQRLHRDELTGLLSRRKFDLDLRSEVAAARRVSGTLAVAILDLDRLKQLNDAHGHLVGAAAIAHVGRLVGESVGERGLCCRLGGDEFGVALPGHGAAVAQAVVEAACARVAANPLVGDGPSHSITVSAGVAVFPDHGFTPQGLLRAADRALYAAKRAGGGRVRVAGEG